MAASGLAKRSALLFFCIQIFDYITLQWCSTSVLFLLEIVWSLSFKFFKIKLINMSEDLNSAAHYYSYRSRIEGYRNSNDGQWKWKYQSGIHSYDSRSVSIHPWRSHCFFNLCGLLSSHSMFQTLSRERKERNQIWGLVNNLRLLSIVNESFACFWKCKRHSIYSVDHSSEWMMSLHVRRAV